jgi:hypothetical protein
VLKSKMDLLVDVSHSTTWRKRLMLQTSSWQTFWNQMSGSPPNSRKFQSIVHHHENVVKSAQNCRLAPGALPLDVLDKILNHTLSMARKRNIVSFVNYASVLFQVEVSHLYNPKTLQFTLIVHIPLISNAYLLELYEFLPLPIHFNFSANVSNV